MSLHDELLDTARYLLRRNQNRPSQADLRRSISTAYYALFHRLVDDGASRLGIVGEPQDVLARTFTHTDMKKSCQLLLKSPVPQAAVPLLGASITSDELKNVARTFVVLQELRHEADYYRGRVFVKSEARDAVGRVEAAFRDWDQVRNTPIAQVFLSLLLLGDRWNRG